jgi:hypothetical protein
MSRYVFTPSSVTSTGSPQRLTFWDRAVGGRRVFDVYQLDGSDNPTLGYPNGVILTDAAGAVAPFIGPDDVTTIWLHPAGAGSRTAVAAARLAQSETRTAKSAITGSRASNAALASLLAALAAQGLITDSTTA